MVQRNTGEPKRLKIRHIFLALLLILLVWLVFYRVTAHRDLRRRVGELRAQGYPMNLEELNRSYDLPAGADNAADFYVTAFSRYVEWDSEAREGVPWVGKGKRLSRTESLEVSILERSERFLSDNSETLSLLHEAVGSEHCRYPVDLTDTSDANMEWLPRVRRSAFLLCLEALVACERDDPNQAMRSIHANLALARSVNAPILIHRLVRIAVEALAYGNIERVLSRMSLGDEQLQTLSGWLAADDDEAGCQQVFAGERCFGLEAFRGSGGQHPAHEGTGGKVLRLINIPRKLLGLHDRDMLGYINQLQDCIEAADFSAENEMAGGGLIGRIPKEDKGGGLLTRLLSPAFTRIFQLEVRRIAGQRVAQTALAVERYRLAEGRVPRMLSDLVPVYLEAVPKDPFDGQDLRYDVLASGYVVYSVGVDLSDDGGAEKDDRKRGGRGEARWDVTFVVER